MNRLKISLLLLPAILSGCSIQRASNQDRDYYYLDPNKDLSTIGRVVIVELHNTSNYPQVETNITKLLFQALQKKQELIEENKGLKRQITPLSAELEQTRKELAETTELVIDMRIELNNWKTDILGFRDEIRTAEKTQLKALLKILTILGGEVKTEPKQIEDESSKP